MRNKFQKIFILTAFSLALIMCLPSCSKQKIISLKTLLMEMTDRTSLTLYPDPYYDLKQFSSYDKRSVKADGEGWFANADYTQFLGVDSSKGRKEYILFDSDGPGAVVRWWMTFAGKGSYEGMIRVFIDNSDKPVIEDNIFKVLSGQLLAGEPLSSSVSPATDLYQRGHNLYLPVPFAKHCRITYECKAIIITATSRKPSIYYNICYRIYQSGTKVVSYSENELKNAEELIKKVNLRLLSPVDSTVKDVRRWNGSASITPGDSLTVTPGVSRSAICRIIVNLKAENMPQALRSTVLKITFDGINSVWVPAGEFFGTGYNMTVTSTWNSKVKESGSMESYWHMPYMNRCVVSLVNFGSQKVEAGLEVETIKYGWKDNSMYFGASWHEYHNIQTAGEESVGGTGKHRDINFIDINGKGVYAGDAITLFNTVDAWFGEGDEKIFVDGESFPSSIGTGTEDYYGYAWARPELFTHPFIAQPSGSGNFHPGLTINIRYRDLDAVPFRSSISANIELWHWAPTIMNYALTSYWYVLPEYETNISPRPESVKNPVPARRSDIIIPAADEKGIIEGEYLDVTGCDGGTAEVQYITELDWSNKGQLWWHDGSPGNKMHMRFLMKDSGLFQVTARLSRAVDYGIIGFEMNGKPVNRIFNGYVPENVKATEINLGKWELKKGENIFTIVIKRKDKNAKPGFMAGVDYLKFSASK